MSSQFKLRRGKLTAEISPVGAEILSLRESDLGEFIWQANSESWPRRSPVLFPVIGRYPAGLVTVHGRPLELPRHGFAPDAAFKVTTLSEVACEMELNSSAATRELYPFDFSLSVRHELHNDGLRSTFQVVNPSDAVVLPFMLGGHPGFSWPLPWAGDRAAHTLQFEKQEQTRTSILTTVEKPRLGQEFDGWQLRPAELVFGGNTHVLTSVKSKAVSFGTEQVFVKLSFEGFSNLALWTRDDAQFLCVEPWSNLPIFVETPTEMIDTGDIKLIPPGHSMTFCMNIELGGTAIHGLTEAGPV